MSLQRDRRAENLEKMEKTKKKVNKGYDDNQISVNINIGSEDKISDSQNETHIKSAPQPVEEKVEDKQKRDEVDLLLKELKKDIAKFNAKKQSLINNKIDIPNDIFDLPPIEINSKQDIQRLREVIQEKINKLDTILMKPPTPVAPLESSMSSQPSQFSRESPFGFQMPPQQVAPVIPPRVPPTTPAIGEKPTDIRSPVRDYDNEAKIIYNNFKNEANKVLGTTSLADSDIIAGKSNNVIKQLKELKMAEPTKQGKDVIDNYIIQTQELRRLINKQYAELIKSQPPPPTPSQPPPSQPPPGEVTPIEPPPSGDEPPPYDAEGRYKQLENEVNTNIAKTDKDALVMLRSKVADLINVTRETNRDVFSKAVRLSDRLISRIQELDAGVTTAPSTRMKEALQQRIKQLNNYKKNIVPTGRSTNTLNIIEKQVDDLLKVLNFALNKSDLTKEEYDNVIDDKVDLDLTYGRLAPIKAFRNISDKKLSSVDKIDFKEISNPDLPPNASKQYKVYLNDNEVKGTDSTGTPKFERVFNKNGDLYTSRDMRSPIPDDPGSVVPEEPTTGTTPPPTTRPEDRPQVPPTTIPPSTTPPSTTPPSDPDFDIPPTFPDARRTKLEGYRNSLYFVNIPNHNNQIIKLNTEITEALANDKVITLDKTNGNIPLAVALKEANIAPSNVNSVSFERVPPVMLPGNANPGYNLLVNNDYYKKEGQAINFNQWGNVYLSGDYRGLPVFITTYPYREGGRLDYKDRINFDDQQENLQNAGDNFGGGWNDIFRKIFDARFP